MAGFYRILAFLPMAESGQFAQNTSMIQELASFSFCALVALAQDPTNYAAEFGKRWTATRKMTIGVAEAMRTDEYAFKPDPPSMSFGEQMLHIGWANYAFCSALK